MSKGEGWRSPAAPGIWAELHEAIQKGPLGECNWKRWPHFRFQRVWGLGSSLGLDVDVTGGVTPWALPSWSSLPAVCLPWGVLISLPRPAGNVTKLPCRTVPGPSWGRDLPWTQSACPDPAFPAGRIFHVLPIYSSPPPNGLFRSQPKGRTFGGWISWIPFIWYHIHRQGPCVCLSALGGLPGSSFQS